MTEWWNDESISNQEFFFNLAVGTHKVLFADAIIHEEEEAGRKIIEAFVEKLFKIDEGIIWNDYYFVDEKITKIQYTTYMERAVRALADETKTYMDQLTAES